MTRGMEAKRAYSSVVHESGCAIRPSIGASASCCAGCILHLENRIKKALSFGQDEKAYMHAVIHSWWRRNSLLTDQDAFITSRPTFGIECFKKSGSRKKFA